MQACDLGRTCPLRYWHLTEEERLTIMLAMADNYEAWEILHGFYLRTDDEVMFCEPAEVH